MTGEPTVPSTETRQDDAERCASCGHTLADHESRYGRCEAWPFCACQMFREARS